MMPLSYSFNRVVSNYKITKSESYSQLEIMQAYIQASCI